MSQNRLVITGLDELKQALRDLPTTLQEAAADIVENAAELAKSEIVQRYPLRTGNLRNHVTVSHFERGRFSAGAIVKNTAKHAWIFEHGSQARHTSIGANRGSMPPGHVFLPAVIRQRRAMYARLKELLISHGLAVSGTP